MLENWKDEAPRDRIIVALDCDRARALDLADMLSGHAAWLKIGMTLFYKLGPQIVYELKERGFKIFLDLKFHDIPHQVRGAASSATHNGADMLTMHAVGGLPMMQAAVEGARTAASDFGIPEPVTLGITVLTSMDAETLATTGVTRSVEEQVRALASMAKEAGLSGVVASPLEAPILRELLGPNAFIVTPGVRPTWASKGDQSRVTTPAMAFENGASHLVIGRPITEADDPVAAFERIVSELEEA
ncbi:MAG: orotidine-5'-phosphate decarboxylase [Eggerthellaceae bacterium]|nr:orotidine-5'-phosphate decarboxylase [Eggerthellaceae bacterium]